MPTELLERPVAYPVNDVKDYWQLDTTEAIANPCERVQKKCPNSADYRVVWGVCPEHGNHDQRLCKDCYNYLVMEDDNIPVLCTLPTGEFGKEECEEEVTALYVERLS